MALIEILYDRLQGDQEGGVVGDLQAEQMTQLIHADEDAGPGGEADHNRIGNEIDQHAQTGQSQNQAEDADENGHQTGRGEELPRAGFGDCYEHGENQEGAGVGWACMEMVGRPPQRADDRGDHCRVKSHARGQLGDHRVSERLRQQDDRHGQGRGEVRLKVLPLVAKQQGDRSGEKIGSFLPNLI